MMDGLVGWVIVALAAGSAGIGVLRRLVERRRVRHELKVRPALAAGLPEGTIVRVTGVVQPIDLLVAPLSGEPCVVYRSRVDVTSWVLRGALRTGAREAMAIAPFVTAVTRASCWSMARPRCSISCRFSWAPPIR